MDNLDIQNATTTLNTIYFFKCAQKQGYTQARLEDMLIQLFGFTREKAVQIIYDAAPFYYKASHQEKCINYLVRYIRCTIRN